MDAVASIPSGISNIFNSILSPANSLENGTTEKTLRGVGSLAAGTAGAGVGAMAGTPLAPFTLGLSVPIGAAIGGGAGLMGFDWANELTGADAPRTDQERLQSLGENTGTGLALGLAGKALESGVGKIAGAKEAANKLRSLFIRN